MKFTDKKRNKIFIFFLIVLLVVSMFGFVPIVKANPTYEDFTTYTEVDPNSHISKTANHIDFKAYRNEDAYVYADKGVNHFGTSWEHKIDVKAVLDSVNGASGYIWTLANLVDDFKGIDTANDNALTVWLMYTTTLGYRLHLKELYLGTEYDSEYGITVNTPYYLTIKRDGTAFTCKVYSDSARTTLLTTLSRTLHGSPHPSYRYVYASQTYNVAIADYLDCDVDNLDLQEVSKSWNIAETWKLNIHTLKWFTSELWKINIYTYKWFVTEIWKLQLHNYSWFNVETWLFNIHNFAWFFAEKWLLNLHNYSWFNSETWLLYLHNFSWFNVESWKLEIYTFIWSLAEIWKINIYTYNWFISEIWKLSIPSFNWFNVETWLFNIHNFAWFTTEIWKLSIGNIYWWFAEIWKINLQIPVVTVNIALLYSILAIMIALVAVVFALSKEEKNK